MTTVKIPTVALAQYLFEHLDEESLRAVLVEWLEEHNMIEDEDSVGLINIYTLEDDNTKCEIEFFDSEDDDMLDDDEREVFEG
jgi:hypothetical protein